MLGAAIEHINLVVQWNNIFVAFWTKAKNQCEYGMFTFSICEKNVVFRQK